MPPRRTISSFVLTAVTLFFMFITGLLLKARFRLPSERKAEEAARLAQEDPVARVPKAVPVGQRIYEPRSYKSGAFWVLPHPKFVVARSNEADTLRIRSGPREDVFVLYGVDAAQPTLTHPKRVAAQAVYFGKVTEPKVLQVGAQALAWVTQLLTNHPFIVYTQWTKAPETERYYAFVRVQVDGRQRDLGELLVEQGFAAPDGPAPDAVPEVGHTPPEYHRALQKCLARARAAGAGVWGM